MLLALCLGAGGCARSTGRGGEATPIIAVERRGLAERLALMDRYRLHDEDRRRAMARPRVWVEELSAGEAADHHAFTAEATDHHAPTAEATDHHAPTAEATDHHAPTAEATDHHASTRGRRAKRDEHVPTAPPRDTATRASGPDDDR